METNKLKQDFSELHGDAFVAAFDEEFEISDVDSVNRSTKHRLTVKLYDFLHNKAIWYVAGVLDVILVLLLIKYL
jgi:hypothetical protein